jgi:hypothetical protein
MLALDEQDQQNGRAALQRHPAVLPQAVDRQIQIPGTARSALWLRAVHPMLERPSARDVLGRLDADAHLVAVVGPGTRQAVHGRADQAPQNAAPPSDQLSYRGIWLLAVRDADMGKRMP